MMRAHHIPSGGFQNPWPPKANLLDSVGAILRIPLSKARTFESPVDPAKTIPCNFDLPCELQNSHFISATWLGHAGFYVELPRSNAPQPIRVVFDPIFAERASPSTWIGPRRYLSAPCEVVDLPGIDFVVISHNHYDHLDIQCLRQIHARWPKAHFLVPLGVKRSITAEINMEDSKIQEMDWWERSSFPIADAVVEFICTPAQHNSGRGVFDQCKSLWSSWVVRQLSTSGSPPVASMYFAGDTGYLTASGPCPAFKEIGERYGPFDLAMIPIWRGASLSVLGRMGFRLKPDATETLLSTLHASPTDAVSLAKDVRANKAIAMHYGTFCGSEDEAMEPLVLLRDELQRQNSSWIEKGGRIWKDDGFGAVDVGETVFIPLHVESEQPVFIS
ncbi:Metallo-hydrolase/oxidoreductase [Pholiota conissans]|uniref:Metallo-hydrolase/oxidoreductase n=1 Tax=Pholiota conissans TaxID=109636 RepID=A0A9P5Z8N2_9AGAR|nr:Metallo-hydrolase/oxidoreductase [Pholiota conissans]